MAPILLLAVILLTTLYYWNNDQQQKIEYTSLPILLKDSNSGTMFNTSAYLEHENIPVTLHKENLEFTTPDTCVVMNSDD